MGTISDKLTYLNETKQKLKDGLNKFGAELTENDTFRSYSNVLNDIYDELPRVTGNGSSFTLEDAQNGYLDDFKMYGNTEQTTYTGKNLFDNVYGQTEKVYTTNIKANSPLMNVNCYPINLLPNTQYTLKVDMNGYQKTGEWIAGICFENGNIISLLQLGSMADITTTTFTTDSTGVVYVGQRYGFTYGTTGRMKVFLQTAKIQLEEGSTATSYEPYVGGTPSPNPDYPQDVRVVTGDNTIHISNSDNTISQEYLLSLGSIELCKIGSYQDYIYKDNGKWYKHSEIGKVVLDGTQAINQINTNQTNTTRIKYLDISDNSIDNNANLYCNRLSGLIMWNTDNEGIYTNANAIVVRINKSTIGTTENNINTYLSANNIILYYPIATPTNEEITDTTLISQLNAIETYTGTNTFSVSNSNDVLPTINVERLKELDKLS